MAKMTAAWSRMCFVVIAVLVLGTLAGRADAQGLQVPPAGFGDLAAALRAIDGCLGVETARTSSGKQVVFAWFENKTAVLRWYYSDAHRRAMSLLDATPSREPLVDIPDDGQPIMAIASVKVSPPSAPDAPPQIVQVAIELYRPAPGGFSQGGTFAPDTLQVPGLIRVH